LLNTFQCPYIPESNLPEIIHRNNNRCSSNQLDCRHHRRMTYQSSFQIVIAETSVHVEHVNAILVT
jgi:hypothetical protein